MVNTYWFLVCSETALSRVYCSPFDLKAMLEMLRCLGFWGGLVACVLVNTGGLITLTHDDDGTVVIISTERIVIDKLYAALKDELDRYV